MEQSEVQKSTEKIVDNAQAANEPAPMRIANEINKEPVDQKLKTKPMTTTASKPTNSAPNKSKPVATSGYSNVPVVGASSSSGAAPTNVTRPAPLRQQSSNLASWFRLAVGTEDQNETRVETANNTTSTAATSENDGNNPNGRLSQFVRSISRMGSTILSGMEKVGEGVVSILGLDDSRYQDVLDNMTEDELRRAQEVQAQREREYYMMYGHLEHVDTERGTAENTPTVPNTTVQGGTETRHDDIQVAIPSQEV